MDSRQLAINILEMVDEVLQKHKVKIPKDNIFVRRNDFGIFGKEYFKLEDEITELLHNNLSCEK